MPSARSAAARDRGVDPVRDDKDALGPKGVPLRTPCMTPVLPRLPVGREAIRHDSDGIEVG